MTFICIIIGIGFGFVLGAKLWKHISLVNYESGYRDGVEDSLKMEEYQLGDDVE